jgi:hypothetical protein
MALSDPPRGVIGAIKSRKYGDVFQRRAWVTGKKWHETGTGKLGKKQIVCKMVEVQGCSLNLRAYAIEARK